ncbi:MAG: NAD-dependent epimerase/dehydratase family protein [Oscillospiraceae bacterium]
MLITGGTVFVSRYMAEYFVRRGDEVFVLNRNSRPQSEGVTLIDCDRHDLSDRLKGICFDWVLDVTAYNETDISALLDGLGDFGGYVLISSSAVYPETLPQPFSEEMSCGYNIHWGDYGTNKLAAERLLQSRVPSAYIIRPPYMYGRMNNLYREAYIFDCAEKEHPVYVPHNGEMPLQFFDIGDLCRFVEIITEKKPSQRIFNVGDPAAVTVREWIGLCFEVMGKHAEIISAPEGAELCRYFPFRDYAYMLDISKQQELMPSVKPLETGLRESCEWYLLNKDKVRRKDFFGYISENFR